MCPNSKMFRGQTNQIQQHLTNVFRNVWPPGVRILPTSDQPEHKQCRVFRQQYCMLFPAPQQSSFTVTYLCVKKRKIESNGSGGAIYGETLATDPLFIWLPWHSNQLDMKCRESAMQLVMFKPDLSGFMPAAFRQAAGTVQSRRWCSVHPKTHSSITLPGPGGG